ncbi:glycosyltransferase [Sphingobacterium sp. SG20118]|uniref:glycosyltransferase n=1 Tax=Sphingobacterium TaxID=28453 RepID=UPI0024691115|nr:glycosyltransferase [Sphingobacterium faecium]MDH5828018.1 glycosyltransferase [Sphingobacterium faecium]
MTIVQQYALYYPYIAFGIIALLLLFQLYYIIVVYGKLSRHQVQSYEQQETVDPISVIICAHNEQENLKQFLTSILEQDYPDFEVIVVNDYSTDETRWVLKDFESKYKHLRVVDIKEHIRLKHGKKFAVSLGIKSAKHEKLVFTDADCNPNSNNWLKETAGALSQPDKEIVIGYSPYFKYNGFLNKLIRFETTHTAMSYLSYALKKDAYMAVGRNMGYTKSLFFRNKGFASHMHIKSGDDDLFVNQNATKSNTIISIHPDAIVYSEPKTTWKSYYKQKARHSGASVIYKKKHQRMLGIQLITSFMFYCAIIITAILFPNYWYVPVAAYLIRLLAQLITFSSIYKKLAVFDLIWWLPLLDIIYYFYICTNGLFNRKKKSISWK